ncbi:unnamed protein product [Discosporangium mesarthrocarpum]
MAGNSPRSAVLRVYREMLRMVSRLPDIAKRNEGIRSIREGFRANTAESDMEKVTTLISEAESRLGFLKISMPRSKVGSSGKMNIVFRDGKEIEGGRGERASRAAHTNWDGKNMDPDSVSRHQRSLSRAGFRDHSHVIGPWGF